MRRNLFQNVTVSCYNLKVTVLPSPKTTGLRPNHTEPETEKGPVIPHKLQTHPKMNVKYSWTPGEKRKETLYLRKSFFFPAGKWNFNPCINNLAIFDLQMTTACISCLTI